MQYLVDTNAWIALFEDSPRLSDMAATLMESATVDCFVSIASVWEAAIKVGIGKLALPYHLQQDLPRIFDENGFSVIGIEFSEAAAVIDLPRLHGDPFDRIMVSQAKQRGWPIISSDPVFDAYGVRRIW
jgi:PIN domain nuclease of toxin-antitoxin system